MTDSGTREPSETPPPLWLALVLAAMAGGMGWGIRGQYGHETGAMIAGLLVGLVLVFLFCPRRTSLGAARAVALVAVGISFGGSMTYGQTVGLTHDGPLIGNWEALRWGLLGLFIKGGIWIAFAGALLGMGLSGRRYRPTEMLCLFVSLVVLLFVGVFLINEPFDPANRELPRFYFSDDWYFEPDNPDVQPRRERWGGLLVALLGLTIYLGWIKKDRLARNLAFSGFLAGGLGFPLGQCVQAYRRWNPEIFTTGFFADFDPYMNWWNFMEIGFGAVLGAGLALGLWLNRGLIAQRAIDERPDLAPGVEWVLIVLHAMALVVWSFLSVRPLDWFADLALTMGIVPIFGIVGGRLWPYFLALPLLALPIAGKTLRQMSYKTSEIPVSIGWIFLVLVPMALVVVVALRFLSRAQRGQDGGAFSRGALIFTTWFYFSINFVFFELPWPWSVPTFRTPSAWILVVCALGLTLGAVLYDRRSAASSRRDRSRG